MEAELTCPVCLDLFEEPLLLPCLHSLCRKCTDILDSVTRKAGEEEGAEGGEAAGKKEPPGQPKDKDKLTCPTCRREVPLDERGVAGLSRNMALQNIVDRFREDRGKHDTAPPCQLCEGAPRPAVKLCVNCEVAYCEPCLSTFHPARGPLARHTLVPPGQQPGKAEPKVVMCAEHADEKVNLYCKVDEMPICSLCKLVGKHQSHDVTALSDVYQEKRDKRKEWQERLVRDTARLEKILQERKKFLAGALIQEEEEKLKLLKEEIAKKEGHLKKAQAVVAYADEVLKEKDQSCFLQAVKSTRERVEQGQNKDALVVPADLVFKGFDLSRQLEALKAIDQNELSTSWQECVDKLSTSSYLKTGRGDHVLHRNGDKLVDGNPKTYWHSDNSKQAKHWVRLQLKPGVQARTLRLSFVPSGQPIGRFFATMLNQQGSWTENRKPDKVTVLAGDDFDNMAALETVHIRKEEKEIILGTDTDKRFLQLTFEMKTPSDCIVSQLSIVASKVPKPRASRSGCGIQ
ncbi:MID2 [Branchiostoma lanceolatum]|uniref:MID2 protein n=1 Tax=Branchiostoma lanceolatum TaxID=7740 RepID=A0A8K0ABB9_BRALA|nr:MID2 [Branchiostoma lanceolatum]